MKTNILSLHLTLFHKAHQRHRERSTRNMIQAGEIVLVSKTNIESLIVGLMNSDVNLYIS
jgi:hypothetical protein